MAIGHETLVTTGDLGRISLTDRAWIHTFKTMGRVWGHYVRGLHIHKPYA